MVGRAQRSASLPNSASASESYRAVTALVRRRVCPGTNGGWRRVWALGDSANLLEFPSAPNGT
jgi:hypothetical protein